MKIVAIVDIYNFVLWAAGCPRLMINSSLGPLLVSDPAAQIHKSLWPIFEISNPIFELVVHTYQ
jgi:hypothetical protein